MNGRLTVLHVGKFYPPAPGGMERVVQSLCETPQQQLESRVLVSNTTWRTVREEVRGAQIVRTGALGQIGSVGLCPTFPLEVARTRRDLTVIHEPNPVALVSDWLTRQRGPLVVWFHSEVFRPRWKYRVLYRPFLRRVLARCSAIVVSSPRLAENAAELRDFRHKCHVIPFGIDPDRLKLTPHVAEKVEKIKRRIPGPRVLFLGRLVAYKGVDVLVRAMRRVAASAIIVGDGPLLTSVRADAARLEIAHRITFTGHLPDLEVVAHLHACDVFVLPSVTDAETFGVAQLEAMACGKPVVSTDLATGVPWVNRHGETGLVVPPGNADALATAIQTLLDDEPLRNRMGAAARLRVAEEFTVTRMAADAATLYRQVAAERTAQSLAAAQPAVSGKTDTF